jgi:hypothetical protein
VSTSVVECIIEVSIINRKYTDRMKFAVFMAVSFIIIFLILLFLFFIAVCTYMIVCFVCFCLILLIAYSYCYVRSFLGILFHCVVLCIVCM